jgi:5-methylcytosine-specific restriction endonuclease McrA
MEKTKEFWKQYYADNKEKIREYQTNYYKDLQRRQRYYKNRRAWKKLHGLQVIAWRLNAKHKTNYTATQLFGLVKKQKRRCALTGRRLTFDNISVDHIIPVKNGGTSEIENLRFVINEANMAKGILNDAELVSLCRDIIEHYDKSN